MRGSKRRESEGRRGALSRVRVYLRAECCVCDSHTPWRQGEFRKHLRAIGVTETTPTEMDELFDEWDLDSMRTTIKFVTRTAPLCPCPSAVYSGIHFDPGGQAPRQSI